MSPRAASAGSDSELVAVGDARRLVLAEVTVDVGAENRERVPGAQACAQRDTAQVIRATGLEAAAEQGQPLGQRPDVFAAVAQGRNNNGEHIQSVK